MSLPANPIAAMSELVQTVDRHFSAARDGVNAVADRTTSQTFAATAYEQGALRT
jgi:hypothetical protein